MQASSNQHSAENWVGFPGKVTESGEDSFFIFSSSVGVNLVFCRPKDIAFYIQICKCSLTKVAFKC